MPDKTDFYQRLNLETGASEEAIKKAYRLAVKQAHPDVNKDQGATQLFLGIQEAYKTLSDPSQKDAYDQGRQPDQSAQAIHTALQYSQSALIKLDEPQVIYTLVDIVSSQEEDLRRSDLPLNIALVVDVSTSMAGPRLEILKSAAKDFMKKLGPNDLITLVSFNDRATVHLASQSQPTDAQIETSLTGLFAQGGTEIFQGLEAGFEEIRSKTSLDFVSQIILITDGHTYGDEDNCLRLAKSAANLDIGISGLGIGVEWNDEFIEELCAMTGGQCYFIQKSKNLKVVLGQVITSLHEAQSRRLSLEIKTAPGVELLSAFRILPESIPLKPQQEYALGILKKDQQHRVLFEFKIDPVGSELDHGVIASGEFVIKHFPRDFHLPFTLDRPIIEDAAELTPPEKEIFQAISHLTFYRLQEKAQRDIATGNPGSAYQRLINLSSHLMAKGENSLAKVAMNEADYIKNNKNFSPDGKKELKYGTMRLLLPENK
jgi:Ca-activated chloride channel family protein